MPTSPNAPASSLPLPPTRPVPVLDDDASAPTVSAQLAHDADGAALERPGRGPWQIGVAIIVLLAAAFLVGQAARGRRPFGTAGSAKDVRIALLHVVMAGCFPAALLSLRQRARRTLDALGARDPLSGAALPTRLMPSRGALLLAGAGGLLLSFLGPYLMEPDVAGPLAWWDPSRWTPETAWHRMLGPWTGAAAVALMLSIVVVARRLSRVPPAFTLDELLTPTTLAPYVQLSLHMALLALLQLSLYAAFAIDFGAARQVLWNVGIAAGLLAIALVLPLSGVRARAAAVKRDELAWCDAELRRARHALRDGGERGRGGLLADLVAYRTVVERASDWGFDLPALRRLALYLLLPLGSWVASSLVQHVLERYVLRG